MITFALSALVIMTGVDPVSVVEYSIVFSVVILPFTYFPVLVIARDKELLTLENKIKPVIDQLGKEMGLAAILNKFESGLVYASDAIDITDTVIKRFNDATTAAPATQPAAKKQ